MPDKSPSASVEAAFQRLFSRLFREAEMLLLHGAMPLEIDEALTAFGFTVGLFELQDQIGTEVEYYRRRKMRQEGAWPEGYHSLISDRMVEEGRLGRQSVVGWYRYPGGKGKVEDPLIEDLVSEESHFASIQRQTIAETEILDILLACLADEALAIGSEGLLSSEEINILSVEKLGFPASHGGIITYAEDVGFAVLQERYRSAAERFEWLPELPNLSSLQTEF